MRVVGQILKTVLRTPEGNVLPIDVQLDYFAVRESIR